MKRVGNLMQQIHCLDNLYLAYYKAKRTKGLKPEIIAYEKQLTQNLRILQNQIALGNIKVRNYHYFTIFDPKKRLICASAFNERVLHHAIMNVCHPYFEKQLISDTYATRLNKGTFKAIEKARFFCKNYNYYLKLDIRKYFDSIDHEILKKLLGKLFKDNDLLHVFENIIQSYAVLPNKGVPIGNLTSQYFANHYLSGFDHWIKDKLTTKAYVRYMDDFIIWENDLEKLRQLSNLVTNYLQQNLKLNLKTNIIGKTDKGLSFLGFKLFPNKILLARRSKLRFQFKINKLTEQYKRNEISQSDFAKCATALYSFIEKAYSKRYKTKIYRQLKFHEIENYC